jgi:hypothetical protein
LIIGHKCHERERNRNIPHFAFSSTAIAARTASIGDVTGSAVGN